MKYLMGFVLIVFLFFVACNGEDEKTTGLTGIWSRYEGINKQGGLSGRYTIQSDGSYEYHYYTNGIANPEFGNDAKGTITYQGNQLTKNFLEMGLADGSWSPYPFNLKTIEDFYLNNTILIEWRYLFLRQGIGTNFSDVWIANIKGYSNNVLFMNDRDTLYLSPTSATLVNEYTNHLTGAYIPETNIFDVIFLSNNIYMLTNTGGGFGSDFYYVLEGNILYDLGEVFYKE